jgi:hypothetical protein
MFDNLSRLAEDVGVRIINATDRTSRLVDKLVVLEEKIIQNNVKSSTLDENETIRKKKQTMKFLKVRSAQYIPSALNKQTNCAQLNGLYSNCNLPPQFWKLEAVTFDDCLIRYSNPGVKLFSSSSDAIYIIYFENLLIDSYGYILCMLAICV